jgi:ankyrin repeat protein
MGITLVHKMGMSAFKYIVPAILFTVLFVGCGRPIYVAAEPDLQLLVMAGDEQGVIEFIQSNPGSIHELDSDGYTLLMRAVESFQSSMAILLIESGADVLQKSQTIYSPKKSLPLGVSIIMNNIEMSKAILSKDALYETQSINEYREMILRGDDLQTRAEYSELFEEKFKDVP